MKELGITKGEWKKHKIDLADYKSVAISSNQKNTVLAHLYLENGDITEEHLANAKLIADAGTTANKCNLLPSELLERYNEVIDVLKLAQQHLEYCGWGDDYESECAEAQGLPRKIEQTISKANEN